MQKGLSLKAIVRGGRHVESSVQNHNPIAFGKLGIKDLTRDSQLPLQNDNHTPPLTRDRATQLGIGMVRDGDVGVVDGLICDSAVPGTRQKLDI
jgi:hypothetical protein